MYSRAAIASEQDLAYLTASGILATVRGSALEQRDRLLSSESERSRAASSQDALLIPVSQNEIAHEVKAICEELGCSKLAVVAYSLRHGGPSWDFMENFRSLEEIRQRGR